MNVEPLNSTNIVLIPKCPLPDDITKFRLISLYNVLYKLVIKVIVNQFKQVLDLCINKA